MTEEAREGQAAQEIGAGRVQIDFVETPLRVSVDMALLTWGDLLDVQRLQRQGKDGDDNGEAERALNAMVSKITGQEATELPAVVVSRVIEAIKNRTAGAAAKN